MSTSLTLSTRFSFTPRSTADHTGGAKQALANLNGISRRRLLFRSVTVTSVELVLARPIKGSLTFSVALTPTGIEDASFNSAAVASELPGAIFVTLRHEQTSSDDLRLTLPWPDILNRELNFDKSDGTFPAAITIGYTQSDAPVDKPISGQVIAHVDVSGIGYLV